MELELTKNQKVIILKAMDSSIAELQSLTGRDKTYDVWDAPEMYQACIDLNNLYTAKRKLINSL
jgi:hypothetical protein